MGYEESNGICREALRLISSDENFESRLVRAFTAMSASKEADTSAENWTEWKELERKYQIANAEVVKQRKEGFVSQSKTAALKEFSQSLVDLICNWMELTNIQIGKGKLEKA
jgi:hypothetical protein